MFGAFGDGQTIRTVVIGAAITCAGATFLGLGAERFAGIEAPLAGVGSVARAPVNAIDYARTGSLIGDKRDELVVLGPCDDGADRR